MITCPVCRFPVLTDIVHYYDGVPYMVKGCPHCHWISLTPPERILPLFTSTGIHFGPEDYQSTTRCTVYIDDVVEK